MTAEWTKKMEGYGRLFDFHKPSIDYKYEKEILLLTPVGKMWGKSAHQKRSRINI